MADTHYKRRRSKSGMQKIETVLNSVLKPAGFQKTRLHWWTFKNYVFARISYYNASFDDHGFVDVALQVLENAPERIYLGVWDALVRVNKIMTRSAQISSQDIRREMSNEHAQLLKQALENDVCPLLHEVTEDPNKIRRLVSQPPWIIKPVLWKKLRQLGSSGLT